MLKTNQQVAVLQGVGRLYGAVIALDGIDLELRRSEIIGLVGPNGAGKTTLLRLLVGLLKPTTGVVRVLGADPAQTARARRPIGYLPDTAPLRLEMTVEEEVNLAARAHGLGGPSARQAIDEAFERCGLMAMRRVVCGTLSRGYRQRVGLAQAIVHKPTLLVLDEPMSGLDPNQNQALRTLIVDLATDCSVLMSSHRLDELQRISDRLVFLRGGALVADASPQSLTELNRSEARFHSRSALDEVLTKVTNFTGLEHIELTETKGSFHVRFDGAEAERSQFARQAVGAGWQLLELSDLRRTLDEVFAQFTRDGCP